jgi:predicted MPP superfamily phosphohydrolase
MQVTSRSEAGPRRLTRRGFLRRAGWASAAVLGGGSCASAFGERNWPRVRRVTIAPAGLPAELHDYTICQISDLHRGLLVSEQFIRRGVQLANSLRADLMVVTGDFISDRSHYAVSCAEALSGLQAPDGVYGVLGNHDYWNDDPQAVIAALERKGIQLLTNRSVTLERGDVRWNLCGVDDWWAGKPDLGLALANVPDGAFKLLLCHEPDPADDAAKLGIPLQLSGHTHGGQVLLPGRRPLVTPDFGHKYPVGLRRVEGTATQVYTNTGLGVIFPPLRINCPPEVTLITLQRTSPAV